MVIYHFGMFILFLMLTFLTGYLMFANTTAEKPVLAVLWLVACLFNFTTTVLNLGLGIEALVNRD